MEKAGISGRLINLAEKCLGHIKGGMAMVCIVDLVSLQQFQDLVRQP